MIKEKLENAKPTKFFDDDVVKEYETAYRIGYKQAINAFVEKLSGVRCECCGKFREHCSQGNYCFIDEIGEQLKKGIDDYV